jgi:hypothetical protein
MAFYTAVNASYGTPQMGIIEATTPATLNTFAVEKDSSGNPNRIIISAHSSGAFTPNPKVFSYPTAVNAYNKPTGATATVVVEKYYYSLPNVTSESDFFRFDSGISNPSASNTNSSNQTVPWGTTVPNTSTDGAVNCYGCVRKGNFLYVVSYDIARVTRIDLNTATTTTAGFAGSATHGLIAGLTARGQGIALWNGEVYVLLNATTDSTTYADSIVVKINDTSPTTIAFDSHEVSVGKNAVGLVIGGDYMYVPCIGGRQQAGITNGTESKICRIKDLNGTVVSEVVYSGAAGAYDFHGVAVGVTYTLILHYLYDANYLTDWKLSKVLTSDFHDTVNESITSLTAPYLRSGTGASGYFWGITYEAAYQQFWFAQGNPLYIYPYNPGDRTAQQPAFFDMTALYGNAGANMTAVDLTVDKTSANASGQAILRSAVAHEVAMGQFANQAAYIEHLRKQEEAK